MLPGDLSSSQTMERSLTAVLCRLSIARSQLLRINGWENWPSGYRDIPYKSLYVHHSATSVLSRPKMRYPVRALCKHRGFGRPPRQRHCGKARTVDPACILLNLSQDVRKGHGRNGHVDYHNPRATACRIDGTEKSMGCHAKNRRRSSDEQKMNKEGGK